MEQSSESSGDEESGWAGAAQEVDDDVEDLMEEDLYEDQ